MNRKMIISSFIFLGISNPVVATEREKVNSFSDKNYKHKSFKKKSDLKKEIKKNFSKLKKPDVVNREIDNFKPVPVDLNNFPH